MTCPSCGCSRRWRCSSLEALGRQTVFVSGEAGIGKTTLVEHFVEETRRTVRVRVGWGQCVELAGGTEPYLPMLDLLGRLCTAYCACRRNGCDGARALGSELDAADARARRFAAPKG